VQLHHRLKPTSASAPVVSTSHKPLYLSDSASIRVLKTWFYVFFSSDFIQCADMGSPGEHLSYFTSNGALLATFPHLVSVLQPLALVLPVHVCPHIRTAQCAFRTGRELLKSSTNICCTCPTIGVDRDTTEAGSESRRLCGAGDTFRFWTATVDCRKEARIALPNSLYASSNSLRFTHAWPVAALGNPRSHRQA